MKISIRKFLLINLLLTIVATTVLTAVGNYYLDRRDIRNHMDLLLSQASLSYEALLGKDFHSRNLPELQKRLNTIPKTAEVVFTKSKKLHLTDIHDKYQFQVWSDKGKLLLYSASAPLEALSMGKPGFNSIVLNHTHWRTFTTQNSALNLYITVAEKVDIRTLLSHRLARDDIYIMLLTYPLAGLLIWIIVGLGLKSIRRVTDEVSHRAANYLEPVDSQSTPTEIQPLVFELNKLFIRLQQAMEREKRFAGDAAHELRTPLAALKTQTQVALKATDEKVRKNILRNIIIGVDRCTHVVQQLLTLSRLVPEANTIVDFTKVDLPKLTAEIIAQLAPLALKKDIDIELVTKAKNANIRGNITALSILIRNLVDNAIRYTPENGEVKVSIDSSFDKVTLKVIDNGPGIPAELRARVFERFFRVLGNKSPGSGLGLAIVQQIAHLHEAHLKLGPCASGRGLEVEVVFNLESAVGSNFE